jgi:hypothetical protein
MKRDFSMAMQKRAISPAVELRVISRLEVVAAGEPISENPSSGRARMAAL